MSPGELHITPLQGILQMRPSFSYLDKADSKHREREAANEGEGEGGRGEGGRVLDVQMMQSNGTHTLTSWNLEWKNMEPWR